MRTRCPDRFALTLVGLAVLAAIVGYLLTDTINIGGGFGYDGTVYGTLAEHFPAAMRGTGIVLIQDATNLAASGPHGLDSYYALRWIPSALAYLTLVATGSELTASHVISAFRVVDVASVAVIASSWVGSARRLQLSRPAMCLGLCALLLNFAFHTVLYDPVITDEVAFALGAASIYFWLADNTIGLFVATVVAAFAWPSQIVLGCVLLAWPHQRCTIRGRARAHHLNRIALIGAMAALLGYVHLNQAGFQGVSPWPPSRAMLAIGAVVAASFVYLVLRDLVPDSWAVTRRFFVSGLLSARLLLVFLVPVIMVVGDHVIAVRPGQNSAAVFENGFIDGLRLPGLFGIAAAGYYGPILVIGAVCWPRIARLARQCGPGIVVGLAVAVLTLLLGEPRKALSFFPLEVLLVVAVLDRDYVISRSSVAWFALLAFVTSRLWLQIGHLPAGIGLSAMSTAAMQRLFMSTGVWTAPSNYWLQLVAVCLVGAGFVVLTQGRRVDAGSVDQLD